MPKTAFEDVYLTQLEESRGKRWRYTSGEAQRDAEAGYPSRMAHPDLHEWIRSLLNNKSGRYLTPYEVMKLREIEEERRLEEASKRPAFKVPAWMLEDDTGDRFVTTHRCFGKPCPGDPPLPSLVQKTKVVSDKKTEKKSKEGKKTSKNLIKKAKTGKSKEKKEEPQVFKMGDIQEHRYSNRKAWRKDEWPSWETNDIENIYRLVNDHYDPKEKRFRSGWEFLDAQEKEEQRKEDEYWSRPYFTLPKNFIDDWSGDRFLQPCQGEYPCPQKSSFV